MSDRDQPIAARLFDGFSAIDAAAWDRCAGAANPFVSYAFLSAMEDSGSAVAATGWQPLPIALDDGQGFLPAYAKSHSQGEYVFDHGWADAWHRAGGSYYPKLQIAVPFSPVPGPRLLACDPAARPALIAAAEAVVKEHDLSSAHATFIDPGEVAIFEAANWLIRTDRQSIIGNSSPRAGRSLARACLIRPRRGARRGRRRRRRGAPVACRPRWAP